MIITKQKQHPVAEKYNKFITLNNFPITGTSAPAIHIISPQIIVDTLEDNADDDF